MIIVRAKFTNDDQMLISVSRGEAKFKAYLLGFGETCEEGCNCYPKCFNAALERLLKKSEEDTDVARDRYTVICGSNSLSSHPSPDKAELL